MNANAAKFVAIAHEARLVHTGPPPGAIEGSLDLSAISNAMGVPAWQISHWLRKADDKSARPCPTWAPRLLRYLVSDPESDIFSGKQKSTKRVDSGYSEFGLASSERPAPTLAPIKWGSDLR